MLDHFATCDGIDVRKNPKVKTCLCGYSTSIDANYRRHRKLRGKKCSGEVIERQEFQRAEVAEIFRVEFNKNFVAK